MVISFSVQIVNYFLRFVLFLVVNRQPQLAFLRPQHYRLTFHAPHHVEWQPRLATKRHLKYVRLNALLDGFPQLGLYLEVPVRRAQPAKPLVRTLVVVVLHPLADTLLSVLETGKLGPAQELLENRLPEPLDLAQRHRVVGPRLDVPNPVLLQLSLKPARAPPRRVLTAVVRQHLTGRVVLRYRPTVHLKHVLARLAPEKVKPRDIPRIVVDVPDQEGVPAPKAKRKNVRLPQLVRRGTLEEPGTGDVALTLPLFRGNRHERGAVERLTHRLRARLKKKHPL
jgi:hypothetical protein